MSTVYQGSISLAKVKDGESGGPGAHGVNTATIYLYRRSVSVPSAMPIGNLTYTFATGVISATEPGSSLNGWVQNISSLSGTDPLYFIAAVASATTDTDLIASSEWQGPTLMAQDGEDGQDGKDGKDGKDGQDGQPGVNGFNQATISLYQRVNSTPSVPSGNLTYTFSSGALSGNLGDWSREVPNNTNGYPCYVISAAAINREAQDIITSSDWSSPVIMVEDGEDGEDGFSPTATVTKSGHTATITITDKNGTTTQTVTDGASGTSYYTYIRYSSKVTPTSASDVSELPDGKDYFGIQTTTSSTAPAWNDSNWHWTKYVGDEGERGISVTKTQEIYYLTNGNAPTKPADGVEITSTSTAANVWTKAIPTYIANYKYYTSVQTFLSSGTSPISSTSVLNNGLTDANYKAAMANSISQAAEENAQGALSIAQGVRQYFWFQGSDYSASIPAGTYITQIPEASFKNNLNNQPNLLLRSNSINLRYGANTHAQLTSTGLKVLKGGVEGGTIGHSEGIYLSTIGAPLRELIQSSDTTIQVGKDYYQLIGQEYELVEEPNQEDLNAHLYYELNAEKPGVSINNHIPTLIKDTAGVVAGSDYAWQQIVGQKFGIDSNGNLYANGGIIGNKNSSISITESGVNISGTNINFDIINIDNAVSSNSWLSEYGNFQLSQDAKIDYNKQYYEGRQGYALTKDTTIVVGKQYYIQDGIGEEGEIIYTPVANPIASDLDIYYELTTLFEPVKLTEEDDPTDYYELVGMGKSLSNYIDTHLIANGDGLWVTSGNVSKYRLLVADDGVYLYGPEGLISKFGENILFSSSTNQRLGGDDSYIEFAKLNGKENLRIVADDIILGGRNTVERIETFESIVPKIEGDVDAQGKILTQQGEDLNELKGYVRINGSIVQIGDAGANSYVEINGGADVLKVAINIDNKDVAYMSNERFYAPSAVVSNLYMQTNLAGDTPIGGIGWIMRSNGHLSLKRVK